MSIIIRAHIARADNFTIVPNDFARDEGITDKARGLLVRLMSHREGWSVSSDSLSYELTGTHAINSALRELEAAGYLERTQTQGPDGRFGEMELSLTDPHIARSEPLGGFPLTDNPRAGKPRAGKPRAENRPYKKTKPQEDQGEENQGGSPQSGTSPARPADAPLHPTCTRHRRDPSPAPCGACRDARVAYEAARRAELESALAAKANAREEEILNARRAIAACDICDETGYYGMSACTHDPVMEDRERARRRSDELRAKMKWPSRPGAAPPDMEDSAAVGQQ